MSIEDVAGIAREAMIATGFLRLGPSTAIGGRATQAGRAGRHRQTTSMTFLGLTVGCARCHDHKFDPIPQKDYYRMQAVFFSTKPVTYPLVSAEEVAAHQSREQTGLTELAAADRRGRTELEAPYRKRLMDERSPSCPSTCRSRGRRRRTSAPRARS